MTSKVEGEFIELQLMERKISVYLPKEYRLDTERIFPAVFYMMAISYLKIQ